MEFMRENTCVDRKFKNSLRHTFISSPCCVFYRLLAVFTSSSLALSFYVSLACGDQVRFRRKKLHFLNKTEVDMVIFYLKIQHEPVACHNQMCFRLWWVRSVLYLPWQLLDPPGAPQVAPIPYSFACQQRRDVLYFMQINHLHVSKLIPVYISERLGTRQYEQGFSRSTTVGSK